MTETMKYCVYVFVLGQKQLYLCPTVLQITFHKISTFIKNIRQRIKNIVSNHASIFYFDLITNERDSILFCC